MRLPFAMLPVLCLSAAPAMANTTYVYCVENRIEVDMRNPRQMQSDRGHATICIIGPTFDFGPDATRWVEANLRQRVGGPCSCR